MKIFTRYTFFLSLILLGSSLSAQWLNSAESGPAHLALNAMMQQQESTTYADNFPNINLDYAIPRQWNEMLLGSIRRDLARPTVHARNLFHVSAAMYDVWSAFKDEGCTFLFGQTVDSFSCNTVEFIPNDTSEASIDTAISYAVYRILSHRFANSVNAFILQSAYDGHMDSLGLDINFTSQDYANGSAAALGNAVGDCYINFGLQDNSNEQNDYENQVYNPVNDPLIVDLPGNPNITDYNRWQPLTLEIFIDQSGNVIPGSTPPFLSPEWGSVTPFALADSVAQIYQRDGVDYRVYQDPGAPPYIQLDGMGDTEDYRWGFAMVATWSSHLDPADTVMWDISPGGVGNVVDFPTELSEYSDFYDLLDGGAANTGHAENPVTGQPYAPNMVPRGDYARVIAEFWADGPDSETPPGHWFTIFNEYVTDHPDFERRIGGQGPELNEQEWYVKSYFMLGGAMHDVAVSVWGVKGWYDYLRPISAIRAMADLGQSTDPNLPSYHPAGLPLIDGYIELVEPGDPLAGLGDANVGKIKLYAWLSDEAIVNPNTQTAGVGWILAERWVPYQRPSFVTPNFAGYVSGHSTFSSAAATLLTDLTGTAFFPGGMATFTAEQDAFLVFENGPSQDIELQWATYQDAANESALSRIWGGIHPPADDVPGRIMGVQIGTDAYGKAVSYFNDEDGNGLPDLCQGCVLGDACDDEDATTFDDVFVGPCDCAGTPCPVVGTACDDNDPATFDDQADGMCGCAGTPCPVAGMMCDDNDPSTFNDLTDGTCGCVGTPCPVAGTACDDNNPFTINDVADGTCGCAGTPVDCNTGTTTFLVCDDGDPCTINDMQSILDADSTICIPCTGTVLTCETGSNTVMNCDDGDPSTFDDQQTVLDCDSSICVPCAGTPCPMMGTPCDDGDPNTINDVQDGFCNCTGVSSNDELAANPLRVILAPNPVRTDLNITVETAIGSDVQLIVFSSQGRQLFTQRVANAGQNTSFQLSTIDYPAGVYFLRVDMGSVRVNKKFVVVR